MKYLDFTAIQSIININIFLKVYVKKYIQIISVSMKEREEYKVITKLKYIIRSGPENMLWI